MVFESYGMLKKEFAKKPEELNEKQLKKATTMATFLTNIRKVSYFFFSVLLVIVVYSAIQNYNLPWIITTISNGVLGVYLLFKLRDFLRGTI